MIRSIVTSRVLLSTSLRTWAARGLWAFMDQSFFTGSNLVIYLLLARWLPQAEYGVFAVVFAAFLLPAAAYMAVLSEPMLVFGARKYRGVFEEYLETLLRYHWWLAGALTVVLLVASAVCWVSGSRPLASAGVVQAVVAPFILLQWLLRTACYVKLIPRLASLTSLQYFVLTLLGVVFLHRIDRLAATTAFALMGVASLATGIWLGRRLNVRMIRPPNHVLSRKVRNEHWAFGRWAVGAAALTWIPWNVYFVILPLAGGIDDAGAYRALSNVILPVIKANAALGPVLISAFVTAGSGSAFVKRTQAVAAASLLGGATYGFVLVIYHRPIMGWLYAGRYDAVAPLLVWFGVSAAFLGLRWVAEAALRALERADSVFWSNLVSSVVALAVGLLLIPKYGVTGATIGFVLSSIAAAVVFAWYAWLKAPKGGSAVLASTGCEPPHDGPQVIGDAAATWENAVAGRPDVPSKRGNRRQD